MVVSAQVSGTERRLAFVFRHLNRRFPGRYRLAVSPVAFQILNRGGFGLDQLPGVHVFGRPSRLDHKRRSNAPAWVNLGRMVTLGQYRAQMLRWAEREGIEVLQVYLEMVPFLALFPPRDLPFIVSLVSHLPFYFDGRSLSCRLLLRAVARSLKADCLYLPIADGLIGLGADRRKLNWPSRNTTNHERFHPEPKVAEVTLTARAVEFKNPRVVEAVVGRILARFPETRFNLLGAGPLQSELAKVVALNGWKDRVTVGYVEDPSPVVNRSLIHVSLEQFDNSPNQSLLEAMAAGCAVIASDVGTTRQVVTPDVGLLTSLDPEEVAGKIEELLGNPEKAMALGRAARQAILQEHHVDTYIDYLGQLHDFSESRPIVGGHRLAPAA